MKKLIAIIVIFLSINMSAVAKGINIAVVDQVSALLNTEAAKKMLETHKADIETDRGKIISLEKEMTALQKRLEKDSLVMSQSDKSQVASDMRDKELDRSVLIKKLQNKNQAAQQQIMAELGPKLEKVLEAIKDKEKYDIILARQALLWADASIDITKQVTAKLNKMK